MYESFYESTDYELSEIIEMYGEPQQIESADDYEDVSVYGCLEFTDEDENRYINAFGTLWIVPPEIYNAEDY